MAATVTTLLQNCISTHLYVYMYVCTLWVCFPLGVYIYKRNRRTEGHPKLARLLYNTISLYEIPVLGSGEDSGTALVHHTLTLALWPCFEQFYSIELGMAFDVRGENARGREA